MTIASLGRTTMAIAIATGVTVASESGDLAAVKARGALRVIIAAIDDYLANLRRSESWSRLVVRYFGDQALAVLGRAR